MRYSLEPTYRRYVKGYGFLSDVKTIIEKGCGVASKDYLDAVKNKIPNVSGLHLTSVFYSKITEVEKKHLMLKIWLIKQN